MDDRASSDVLALDRPVQAERAGRRDGAVVVLLSAAAILAAIIATRAAFLSADASDAWNLALREEIRRSAATVEDVRFVYTVEGPIAFRVAAAEVRRAEFQLAADATSGAPRDAALTEASIQAGVAEALRPSSDVALDSSYALPAGGYDLLARLVANRARFADLLAIDPEPDQAAGDAASRQAVLMVVAGIAVGIALLCGPLVRAFGPWRRSLLMTGTIAVATGAVVALAVEFLA